MAGQQQRYAAPRHGTLGCRELRPVAMSRWLEVTTKSHHQGSLGNNLTAQHSLQCCSADTSGSSALISESLGLLPTAARDTKPQSPDGGTAQWWPSPVCPCPSSSQLQCQPHPKMSRAREQLQGWHSRDQSQCLLCTLESSSWGWSSCWDAPVEISPCGSSALQIWLLLALPAVGLCWMCAAAAPAAKQTQCQGPEWSGTHQTIAQRHSIFKSLRQFSSWITADASLP